MCDFGCGLLVPGCLQQLWIDVSVRCPHAERYCDSASSPGAAAYAGETEKTERYGTAVRSLVFETYGRLGDEGTKMLRELVSTAAANGRCSPHAVGRWRTQLERVLLTAQADTYLRALGFRVVQRPAVEPPSAVCRVEYTFLFVWRCLHCDSHVKVRLTETETETGTETEVSGALLAACHPLCMFLSCLCALAC